MKLTKRMIAFTMAMMMVVGMSAVSYAKMPAGMMIGVSAPVSMKEYSYRLDLSHALVKHTPQVAKMLSLPIQHQLNPEESLTFYPGDTLYLSLVDTAKDSTYTQKNCPSNWEFYTTNLDPKAVSKVRWANENDVLNLAIDFVENLPQSKPIKLNGKITLYDELNGISAEPLYLEADFSNVTRELLSASINEIISPMNLHAGKQYHGEAVTLSFGNNVYLKNAVMKPRSSMYLNLDRSFDNQIANRYKSFDIQCYHFKGSEDTFAQPGVLYLPAQRTDSYVYEVMEDGSLKRIQSEFDEETGTVFFMANSLGYYIVSPILMQNNY